MLAGSGSMRAAMSPHRIAGRKNMKKILVIMILLLTSISCELFDSNYWDEVDRGMEERGHVCERNEKGYWSCYDTK